MKIGIKGIYKFIIQGDKMKKNSWIKYECTRENPKYRIFCLPYAGGNALYYSKWAEYFNKEIEIYPIQLPGRENRIGECAISDAKVLCKEIITAIKPYLDIPFAFVGHSMGGILCYELTRQLIKDNIAVPEAIFISGTVPPHILKQSEKIYDMPEKEFLKRLVGYDNINPKMFEFKEFYEYFLPTLRADFKLVETYEIEKKESLPCSITVFGGDNDPFVPLKYLKEWNDYSEKNLKIEVFKGNHFYITNHIKNICTIIRETLEN